MNQFLKALVILLIFTPGIALAKTGLNDQTYTNISEYPMNPNNPDSIKRQKMYDRYFQKYRLMIGIEGGLNHTFSYGDFSHKPEYEYPYQNYKFDRHSRSGYSYGLSLQWNFKKWISIRSGLSYDYKAFYSETSFNNNLGSNSPPGLITSFSNQTSSFGYLTIPLMAKVTFGKKIQIFCNAGIFAAFLTKQTDDVASWLKNNYEGPEVYDYKESSNNGIQNYRKMDAGLSCGAGIGVPIGKHLLISAECRYNYGLRNSWRPDYSKEQPFLAKGELLLRTIGGNIGIAYKFSARETDK
ncbi:MAG: porin family protein [Fluviicola sp.]